MNKYLEKIAKEQNQNTLSNSTKALLIGSVTAGLPTSYASHRLGVGIIKGMNDKAQASDIRTVKKFMRDNNLHKTTTFNTRSHSLKREGFSPMQRGAIHQMDRGQHAGLVPSITKGKRNVIAGVRRHPYGAGNTDIIMHELGHAKDLSKHKSLKLVGSAIGRSPIGKIGVTAGTISALSNEKTRDYAPAIAAIPGALVLREEGAANYHAYKGIKAHKGSKMANKFVKSIASKNMLNYGVSAAAPVAAALVGRDLMNRWSEKNKKAGT